MRFFHLADLHIGKKVNQVSMLEDQEAVLAQVLAAIDAHHPQAVVLAGDIYDRRNPGVEAVDLLDRFLSEVVLTRRVPILAIGGNHDSGERLNFATGILARAGLHMAGAFTAEVPKVRLTDDAGAVDFHLLPYADLPMIHHVRPDLTDCAYSEAMAAVIESMDIDVSARNVLIAHGVVSAPDETLCYSDSERELSIGGTQYWSSDALSAFDYVALGHLHRPQTAGADHIRYAGSLLKYSFSEEHHEKAIQMVDLDGTGAVHVTPLPLQPLRDMKTVSGTLAELLATAETAPYREDYLRVQLADRGEVLEPMARLRAVYPHVMTLERLHPFALGQESDRPLGRPAGKSAGPLDQMSAFYEALTDEPPSPAVREIMKELIAEVLEVAK